MGDFACEICSYTTKKRGNYNRHLKTKKHKEKMSKYKFIKKTNSKVLESMVGQFFKVYQTPSL